MAVDVQQLKFKARWIHLATIALVSNMRVASCIAPRPMPTKQSRGSVVLGEDDLVAARFQPNLIQFLANLSEAGNAKIFAFQQVVTRFPNQFANGR